MSREATAHVTLIDRPLRLSWFELVPLADTGEGMAAHPSQPRIKKWGTDAFAPSYALTVNVLPSLSRKRTFFGYPRYALALSSALRGQLLQAIRLDG